MCGIAGIIDGCDRQTLERMASIQAHRGPDDQGIVWFDERRSGLAHRRLSIIDLSPAGHQPMANASGTRWITYNGEIYNYRELRDELRARGHTFVSTSDTEVVLAAFDEWGSACVERFNGMFAFGIYDVERGELTLARDHLGVKPLYYALRGSMLAFASEAKALFELPQIQREIDPDAVISSLTYLWVPEPKTGFTGVLKLLPGHVATFRDGRLDVRQYWDVPLGRSGEERREEEYVEELRELLERAVRRQMIADVPVGAFLSGGLDSSVLVALMRKISNGPIHTYTITFSEAQKRQEAMPDDAAYARRVARQFGTEHHEIAARPDENRLLPTMLYHLDDPVFDGASINTYLIAHAARQRGTVVLLNGMGGDEVFGGYRRQYASLLIERYQRLPRPVRAGLEAVIRALPVSVLGRGVVPVRWAKKFLRTTHLTPLEAFIHGFAYFNAEELRRLLAPPYNRLAFEEIYPIERYHDLVAAAGDIPFVDLMTYLDTKLFLPGLNLLYSDKAAMAASVETRPPLLDVELVEFAARLPARYKINGRVQKYLLKRAATAWLPRDIVHRPKAAFGTPIRAWMRNELADEVRATFTSPSPAVARFIVPSVPRHLLDEHQAGRADNAHSLWGLYAAATWIDMMSAPRLPGGPTGAPPAVALDAFAGEHGGPSLSGPTLTDPTLTGASNTGGAPAATPAGDAP